MCFGSQHSHDEIPASVPGKQTSPMYLDIETSPFDFEGLRMRHYLGEDGVKLGVAIGADDGSVSLNNAPRDNFENTAEVILQNADADKLVGELRDSATRDSIAMPFVLKDEAAGTYISVAGDRHDVSINTRFDDASRGPSAWDTEAILTAEQAVSLADFLDSRPKPAKPLPNAAGI